MAEILTREVVRILDVEPDWVTMKIDEYSRSNWATAGELHSAILGEDYGKQGTNR